ncbi:MAG TPA: DoxX family protein [Saprospiraceae bacterium]|nr:DoxX family protein [Saprospiraceae bacterium]
MKRIINTGINQGYLNIVLLIVRLGVAVSMLTHGLMKLNKVLSGRPIEFADPLGIGQTMTFYIAIFAEVICSFLLLIGLFTRLAAIPPLITMLVIIGIVKSGHAFSDMETEFLYALVYLTLLATGAGKYSIDGYIESKIK